MAEFLDQATKFINCEEMNSSSQYLSSVDKSKKYDRGSKPSCTASASMKPTDLYPMLQEIRTNILLMLRKQNKVSKWSHPIIHNTNKGMDKFCQYLKDWAMTLRLVGSSNTLLLK